MPPVEMQWASIHDEHADAALDERQQLLEEGRVADRSGETSAIHLVGLEGSFDLRPLLKILAVDGFRADPSFSAARIWFRMRESRG